MFYFFFKLFCNTQQIHKLLLREDLDEYNKLNNKFNNENPYYRGYFTVKDYEKLDEENKKMWTHFKIKNIELREKLINDLLAYSKNYPSEKISRNRFIIEYKEYPCRLQDNLLEVLKEL